MKLLPSLGLLGLLAAALPAQTRDDGQLWALWLGHGKLGAEGSSLSNWRWWADVQARFRNDGEDYDTGFVRPGVGYALTERMTLWAGYVFIDNDLPGGGRTHEQRAWQQLTWSAPLEGFSLMSRTRLEQRFVEDQSETGWRFRQLVKATTPLGADGETFLSVWDEAFFDLDDTDWGQRQGFRQNRVFAGLGWFLDPARRHSIEVGYLNQWIDRADEDRLNHVLSINFFMTF
jgi:hypothetical protein